MAISPDFVVNQVVVDVQYGRGMTYFDKCGTLLLKLEDALGKPFEGNVPMMTQGELHSISERLVMTYSQKAFNVTQGWVRSPARVEHVAPLGWEQVADTLNVGRTVSRCGVRFILLWKVDSRAEGEEALARSRFLVASDASKSVLGDGAFKAWSAIVEDARGKLRVSMDVIEINLQGGLLPTDLTEIVPKYAIMLDLDHTHPGTAPYALQRAGLKDFIRSSWQRSRFAAKTIGSQLGAANLDAEPQHTDKED